jgi:hypothetical protein
MFRRYSIVPVVLVLVIASAAVTSKAQSGRGRQLRIQGVLHSESVAPEPTEAEADQKTACGFADAQLVLSRRTKGLIYNDAAANQNKDDGEYHMTRADKRAGWILLGFLVLEVAIIASQD